MTRWVHTAVRVGCCFVGFGLAGLGASCFASPISAAESYGFLTTDEDTLRWVVEVHVAWKRTPSDDVQRSLVFSLKSGYLGAVLPLSARHSSLCAVSHVCDAGGCRHDDRPSVPSALPTPFRLAGFAGAVGLCLVGSALGHE
ncbi:unnamed protein product [Durusdinium trenchii]|uniref:Uncharacterized protein n=1 Tax=Durusdinium trenchii TaxID=1381693 RepID=A0ABP0Q702_9DINO